MAKFPKRFELYNLNIKRLLDVLIQLKQEGYEYVDMKVSNEVSDPNKYLSSIEFYPLENETSKSKNKLIPKKKLTIDELIKYHS